MNIKKSLLAAAFALGCISASAQAAEGATEYVFNPHWYGQLQGGVQETLGETSFGKLISPNAQIGVGYQFSKLFGLRLSVNGWQSKAALETLTRTDHWKWNYVSPVLDLTFSLTDAIGGYNPGRVVNVNLLAGIGANIGFSNDEAATINSQLRTITGLNCLQNLWDGTKTRLTGRMGAAVDFRLSERFSLGIELQANLLNDNYNSKKAPNADWYFNGLVGLKYCFGKTHTTRTIPAPEPVVVIQERIVEVPVEVVREVVREVPAAPVEVVRERISRDVFFTISNTRVSQQELRKVTEIADFLNSHPNATVMITGYADKGTGTLAINLRLAAQRAEAVKKALIEQYHIDPSRIETASMGEEEHQPFADPVLNRVAICVAE